MLEGVREWIPVLGSVKARLVEEAVRAFSARGYAGVGVTELARAAGATTGALYHHFGSKLGLYGVVRDDVERRVLDRMEGAAAAVGTGDPRAAVRAALLVGCDAAVRLGAARLLGEHDPRGVPCPVTAFLSRLLAGEPESLPAVLAAAWRRALQRAAEGEAAAADARLALEWILGARGTSRPRPGRRGGDRPSQPSWR
jgi:AcrR family transcriptional regulator